MPKVKVGKIRRRVHNRDPSSVIPDGMIQHPTVGSNEILKRNSDAKMFSYWNQISSSALAASGNPVGNTTSLRTSQVNEVGSNLISIDPNNFYGGSFVRNPGPGSYKIDETTGIGKQLMRRIGAGTYAGTMGTSERACLLPSASHTLPDRGTVSPRPGPGEYVMNDSAVFGRNSTFDGAFRWNPAKADLDEKETRLQTINCDIKRIMEKLKGIDKLPPEKANAVKLESETTLKKLKRKKMMIQAQIGISKAKIDKMVNHPGRAGKAKKILFDKKRPKSVPMSNTVSDKFFDPIGSTGSYIKAPGPGFYDTAAYGTTFGNATTGVAFRNQGFSWGKQYRPTDVNAPDELSVATLKLNKLGYSYFSDLNPNSAQDYTPNMMVPTVRSEKTRGKGMKVVVETAKFKVKK
ncbi:hypothetical protein TL16_g08204 [Triparma laevis f. inornata]|uniref:Uncharacterized protein n=2 Tax=Triparma laevis TaxID=1534972 RepID=A0A9W7AKV5_9STRA|nr:hypothetical protein TrLO_g3378 [Triparma laevis f. longispina]GMH79624.1 hypothetical protein TL16_g08204 [Triparma laevis f. inornata]